MVDEGGAPRAVVRAVPAIPVRRGAKIPASRDASVLIDQLHARITTMTLAELADVYRTAQVLEVRAWEIQAHACSAALARSEYGAKNYQALARDWGVSRSRVYQLANAWAIRSDFEDRLEVLAALPEAGWWSSAAKAARHTGENPAHWIEQAYLAVTGARRAPRQRGSRYTLADFEDEMQRARQLLEMGTEERDKAISKALRARIGGRLRNQIGSVSIYAERGPGGMSNYPGNHNPFVQLDLWLYYGLPTSVLDPMEGSGTTRDLCRFLGVPYEGYDLKQGFDSLTTPITGLYDFVWWHPPYWGVMRYGPGSMARAESYAAFLAQMRQGFEKFWTQNVAPGGLFAVMLGDYRDGERYYPLCAQATLMGEEFLEGVMVTTHADFRSEHAATAEDAERRHLPLVHEQVALFRMPGGRPRPPVPPPLLPERVWRPRGADDVAPADPPKPEEY